MNRNDELCLKLGRMVAQMIRDAHISTPANDVAYGRRKVTFPEGEIHLFVVKGSELADKFEAAASNNYVVESITLKPADTNETD